MDFVCSRSCLMKLAYASCQQEEAWKFSVEKFNNVFFMRELDKNEKPSWLLKEINYGQQYRNYIFSENTKVSLVYILT